ncbi:MAG: DMT family transporter [Burkholderiales bacterium]|nr:DMT family transporter [Burkholderiales bacterium]
MNHAPARRRRPLILRHAAVVQRRAQRLPATLRGVLWAAAAGLLFVMLNTLLRELARQVNPQVTQFVRYLAGMLVVLPFVLRSGLQSYRPQAYSGHFTRGAVHTLGLLLWFVAVPHIPIAETTAISFTTPIFAMIGAVLVFREPMRADRWIAASMGMAGVLVVVGAQLTGAGGLHSLVMLASAPLFAASFLLTKALTRTERAEVIVLWQAISISLFSLPIALLQWQWPTAAQWVGFAVCGVLGSLGHYCLTQSLAVTDVSTTQSVKFLDLVWASLLGWVVFSDVPSQSTLLGGAVICASVLWLARRESRPR